MARIPEAELERLKREAPLASLVSDSGVELKPRGKDLVGRCPFHEDKTASLVVTPTKNVWHCFGCDAGGSTIDWVMKREGVSFRHAVELLRVDAPLAAQPKTAPKLPCPLDEAATGSTLLKQVASFYADCLSSDAEATGYLESRGLLDEELIRTFNIGVCDRTLGLRLPQNNRKAGRALRGNLQELGVLRRSGHEHFRGCLTFPVTNEKGDVVEMYGRRTGPAKVKHLYLPGPHAGVFNLDGLPGRGQGGDIILCESLIDACTFWVAGFRNVTTSFGASGTTKELLTVLEGARRVLIAFDRDDAGDKAADELSKKLLAAGVEVLRVLFPRGMDANAYAQKVKPASKSLGLALERAAWMCGPRRDASSITAAKESGSPTQSAHSTSPTSSPATTPSPDEEQPPLAACSPEAPPAIQPAGAAYELVGEEVLFNLGPRRWRVRGLYKNTAPEVLKVNLLVSQRERFFVDTFDIYAAKARTFFVKSAAAELFSEPDVIKRELGQVLLSLEQLQAKMLEDELKPKDQTPAMTDAERDAALELLKDERLLARVLEDFDELGVVGEQTNKLVGYLASVSRKLRKPLAVMVQSSSAAGKSSLMEAVLSLVPDEEKVAYSAMTGQSLFYMEDGDLKHKVLAIAEEEGAERASYALKVLQSEGRLCIASTGKDPNTGRHVTSEYEVEGPVAIFSTTTAIDVDEELLNRCLVLTVDETEAQTGSIHERQRSRRLLEGLKVSQQRDALLALHQNAQRLLRPLAVVNPFAQDLTFPAHTTRMRRDHEKYLTLIDTIALVHQHQRDIKQLQTAAGLVEYVEVTLADVALAGELCHRVLGRSLDELPPQTRRLLDLISGHVSKRREQEGCERADVLFTRRELREATGVGNTQLKVHLDRLLDHELIALRRGHNGAKMLYELLWDEERRGGPVLSGLVDIEALAHKYGADLSALRANLSATFRGAFGPLSPTSRPALNDLKSSVQQGFLAVPAKAPTENTIAGSPRRPAVPTNGVHVERHALSGEAH